jgi:hypothetical protein
MFQYFLGSKKAASLLLFGSKQNKPIEKFCYSFSFFLSVVFCGGRIAGSTDGVRFFKQHAATV